MSLFTELKRRNVFRATLAYAVFAWLLLQVVEFVLEVVGSPDWVLRVLVVLALAGLPAVAVFAWAFEITPEGIKRDAEVDRSVSQRSATGQRLTQITLVCMVVLVVFLLTDRFINGETEDAVQTPDTAGPAAPPQPPAQAAAAAASAMPSGTTSVAVLPFANMSPDPDNEFFADGISEELLNVLVDIDGLRVPSRTSSFAFKGMNLDIRDIAAELQVDHVLEGSVRKAGNRVRITAQLIDVATDTHLWSETYDRELQDIFAIQDEIADNIVRAMSDVLKIDARDRPPTEDIEAYTLYLQGRELMRQRDADGLVEAARLLALATERDPAFADAWATRAMVEVLLPGYLKVDIGLHEAAVRDFAERALALDPNHPEARLALGQLSNSLGESAESIRQLQAVVDAHPQHSVARLWLAIGLLQAGYLQDAWGQIDAALRADPVHPTILDWHARIAPIAGRPEYTVFSAERAMQLGRTLGFVALHQYFLETGEAADLAPYLDAGTEPIFGWAPQVFEVRDDPSLLPAALARADEAERQGAGFTAEYMRLNFLLVGGTPDAFFEQVTRMFRVDNTVSALVWVPSAARHRRAPAMKSWVRAMGYDMLWRERGWPDLCRPAGDDDFECD
jgi:TolB-like protein